MINKDKIMDDLDNDWALFLELGGIFLKTEQEMLNELGRAIARHDPAATEHYAHKIKGSFAVFGVNEVVDLAQKIEDMSAAKIMQDVKPLFEELVKASHVVRSEIRDVLERKGVA